MAIACIDFGTARSKAAAALGKTYIELPIGQEGGAPFSADPLSLPSAIYRGTNHVYFGYAAIDAAAEASRSAELILSFKTQYAASTAHTSDGLSLADMSELYVGYLFSLVEAATHRKRPKVRV